MADLNGSATRAKLVQLNEKLKSIDPHCDEERNLRFGQVEARIYALE
jgi:uncharacterized coiled-coil protein SlyX